jgi:hypothetical protein
VSIDSREQCASFASALLERHCRDAIRGLRAIVSAGERASASRVFHASSAVTPHCAFHLDSLRACCVACMLRCLLRGLLRCLLHSLVHSLLRATAKADFASSCCLSRGHCAPREKPQGFLKPAARDVITACEQHACRGAFHTSREVHRRDRRRALRTPPFQTLRLRLLFIRVLLN